MKVGDSVLVTTDLWFYGPDGRDYRGVWGRLESISTDEETLSIRTNSKSTNWYIVVGGVIVAGCQIHYAMPCESRPPDFVEDEHYERGVLTTYTRRSYICAAGVEG